MKNTLATKLTSILVAVMLIIGVTVPAIAVTTENENTAFVVVSGMGVFPLYENKGTYKQQQVFPPETDVIMNAVSDISVPLAKFAFDNDYNALAQKLMPAVVNVFEKIRCDENGDSVYNISTDIYKGSMADNNMPFADATVDETEIAYSACKKFGAENVFIFGYDWRLDPLLIADELNEFIKDVKDETGKSRVSISAFSMGGTATLAYLEKYGSDDIKNCSLCSTAFLGTSCTGKLLSGDINISFTALMTRFSQLTRDNTYSDLVETLSFALKTAGITQSIDEFANNLILNVKGSLYDDALTPVFGMMPGIWALCDDENYEAAKENMLDNNKNAGLIKRIDEYHYSVQKEAKQILDKAKANGTNVYIVAQYNSIGLPVCDASVKNNNDNLIDVKYASGGAIAADFGETLPQGYTQAVNDSHNHISGDNVIDASTAMYPEQTWFVKNMMHVDYPQGEGLDFILWLAESNKEVSVFTDERYTQFMDYSYEKNTLTPITENYSPKATLSDVLSEIIKKLISYIPSISEKIVELLHSMFVYPS